MRISTHVVFDIESGRVLVRESYNYCGSLALCKRGKSKKITERELALRNKQLAEELAFRAKFLNPVLAGLSPFLEEGGQGFTEEELAGMRTQAIEGTSQRFGDLESRLKTSLARRGVFGDGGPAGGDFARTLLQLRAAELSERQGGLRDVSLKNALLRRQNRFNAASVLSGGAAVFNPSTFVSGAGNALNARTQLAFGPGAGLAGSLIGAGVGAVAGGPIGAGIGSRIGRKAGGG